MRPTLTPPLDRDEISVRILRAIASRERRQPRLVGLARLELERLSPDRWTIEWHLPAWLGRRFDLDPGLVDALVRSNVLGLLSVRLGDDLEDGEVALADVPTARALAEIAYEEALAGYRAWFDDRSAIWPFLERSMAAWRAGATGADLAARGAPIRIAGFACCLAAGQVDLWPTLERSLDGAVTALVLYDQFCDWEVDLAAGRWNAFVARAVGADREPAVWCDRDRATVLTAMLTRPIVREHFDAATRAAREAAALAKEIGVVELAAFLDTWAARTTEQRDMVADHYRRAGDRAAQLFFGARMHGVATSR
jgi:hypothetical protein